jgi:hypothetical protein
MTCLIIGAPYGGGGRRAAPPPAQSEIKNNTDFVDTVISEVLRDLRFRLNQPLKSADD